jgi:hypothetical protein
VQQFADRVKNHKVSVEECENDELTMGAVLQKFFAQPQKQRLSEPAVIVDIHGIIMMWYLPGIMSLGRMVVAHPPQAPSMADLLY